MSSGAAKLQAVHAVLVTSDPETIVFIKYLNDSRGAAPFIVKGLSDTQILVKADSVPQLREALRGRVLETIFDEDELAPVPEKQ